MCTWTKRMQATSRICRATTREREKDIKIKHTDHIERIFYRIRDFNWWFEIQKLQPFILIVGQNGIFVFPKNWLFSPFFPLYSFYFMWWLFFFDSPLLLSVLMQLSVRHKPRLVFLCVTSIRFRIFWQIKLNVVMQWYNKIG